MDKPNNIFDKSNFKKIEDIIFFDEPILTHYKKNDKDFLFYLVDTIIEQELDKYLVIEVPESIIFKYLTKRISLRDLILQNNNFGFLIEETFDGVIVNYELINSFKAVNPNYIPLKDSFLEYRPTENSYYYNLIREYERNAYLEELRKNAFYLKLEGKDLKYGSTIGFQELVNKLLLNISKSFKNFLKVDFEKSFETTIGDKNKLNSIFNKLSPDLDFRMVDLKYGSFEIGLSVDKLMKSGIEDKKIKEWSVDIGTKYKDVVLENEYNDKEVNAIINSYDKEERKKIFEPIFKIIDNPNFEMKMKNKNDKKYSSIKIKNRDNIDKILPKIEKVEDVKREYELFNATILVDKSSKSKTIKSGNALFFNQTNETTINLEQKDFEEYNYKVAPDTSIPINLIKKDNSIILNVNYEDLHIEYVLKSTNIDEEKKKVIHKIYEYILNQDT